MGRLASTDSFVLEKSLNLVIQEFRAWHEALLSGAELMSNNWRRLDDQDVCIKLLRGRRSVEGLPGLGFVDGLDGRNVSVEINPPKNPGTVDGMAQVGMDSRRRLWLLRQGSLQRSDSSGKISAQTFAKLSGLQPAFVTPAVGASKGRWWFEVCRLDECPEVMLFQTVAFVRRCQLVRDKVAGKVATAAVSTDEKRSWSFSKALEPTGPCTRPSLPETAIRRIHGLVVNKLVEILHSNGMNAEKMRHSGGYEIDLAVMHKDKPKVLIEVKTGISSGDVQQGVGQLMLYRRLFNLDARCRQVLLLPAEPRKDLQDALQQCGVELHSYRWTGNAPGEGELDFDEFLAACKSNV